MTTTTAYKWSDESPREPGWYWYTGRGWSRSICIEVFQDKHKWIASEFRGDRSTWQDLENMDGRWAGPILEPAF